MNFLEGETVLFNWNDDHTRSRKRGKPAVKKKILKTGEAKFLRIEGNRAWLEFVTPAGSVKRSVPIGKISKKEKE